MIFEVFWEAVAPYSLSGLCLTETFMSYRQTSQNQSTLLVQTLQVRDENILVILKEKEKIMTPEVKQTSISVAMQC